MEKTAFSTGALYTIETIEALTKIRNAGFRHAELMPQCYDDLSLGMLSRIDRIGIHISSIHYPLTFFGILYNANPGMIRESKEFSERLALFARHAGTEYVVVHPENEYKGVLTDKVGKPIRSSLLYLCEALDRANVTVAMENYPTGVGQYPDSLDRYVHELNVPNMKVMVDTTEVIEGGGDPVQFINGLENVPCHLHMSDFADGVKHLPIGTGKVDWQSIADTLKGRGYEGYYNLEPSYKYYFEDMDGQIKRDYEFITSLA